MDLRSRTVDGPSQAPANGQDVEGSESGDSREGAENRRREDETMPFELLNNEPQLRGSPRTSRQPSPTRTRERISSPPFVWRPPRVHFESPRDFEPAFRDYVRENMPPQVGQPDERANQRHNDDQDCRSRQNLPGSVEDYPGRRDEPPRMGINRPRPRETFDCERNRFGQGDFDYERLLPRDRPRYRQQAEQQRPGRWYEPQRPEIRFFDQMLSNEPRPFFPSFSGKHDEWDSFWLKFELLAKRYNWSDEKQREQLLLCLKDEAMNFAASLGPEIRGNLPVFVQALRDRFTHSTPAETVRASLNNIKKSSKETIQEYASRVRTLMTKGYPDIGCTETFTQMTIHHLLQGLPDQTIAYEVLIRKPSSLTDAIDMITWHECCKESTRKKAGLRQIGSFVNEPMSYQTFDSDNVDMEIRRINGKKFVTEERLIQFGRDLKMSIEKLFQTEKSTPETKKESNNKQEEEEVMPKRPERRKIICYNCHEEGHISIRCPLKNRNNTSATERDKQPQKGTTELKQAENFNGLSLLAKSQSQF